MTAVESTLPGIGQYKAHVPIKVTNMQLMSTPFGAFSDRTFGGTLHISEEVLQYEMQKGKNVKNLKKRGNSLIAYIRWMGSIHT